MALTLFRRNVAFPSNPRAAWLRGIAFTLAAVIFMIDALTPLDVAIAVLYVVVILLIAMTGNRKLTLYIGIACIALTVVGYLLPHFSIYSAQATARSAVGLLAIVTTLFLSMRNLANTEMVLEKVKLLELSHDAIVVHRLDGTVQSWNRGAHALYGRTESDVIGRPLHQLLGTVFPQPWESIQQSLHTTGQWDGQLVQQRSDGTLVTVESRWSLLRDAQGNAQAVLTTNNDITERVRAQEALHQSMRDLGHVARLSTLGELAASIAHEVSQPIAAVVTNGGAALRWLKRAEPNFEEGCTAIENMIRDAQRSNDVVRRVRALAQKREAQFHPIMVNDIVTESVELLRREFESQGVRLTLDLTQSLPAVYIDKIQIQQVVMNLLMNAVQAMADMARQSRVLVVKTTEEASGATRFSVTDKGPGISPEIEKRLFSPFFSTKTDGMGMGLVIARSIIESHGGTIRLESAPADGTTASFSIPPYTKV